MNKKRTIMGKLNAQGLLPVLRSAHKQNWEGALRLRKGAENGTIWFVKGQIVHCLHILKQQQLDGMDAYRSLLTWTEGAFLLESSVLPPDRTIRQSMPELIKLAEEMNVSNGDVRIEGEAELLNNLEGVLGTLRTRVPGLESLSVLNGDTIKATTVCQSTEREWLDNQLHAYFLSGRNNPARLFFEQDEHALLVIRNGFKAMVLAAKSGTAPEALFWAGEEANKQMTDSDKKA
jgi:hypothetical protein